MTINMSFFSDADGFWTSEYSDLSPLYGQNLQNKRMLRTMLQASQILKNSDILQSTVPYCVSGVSNPS